MNPRTMLLALSLVGATTLHADPAGDRRGYTLLKRYRTGPARVAQALLAQTDEAGRAEVLQAALAYAAYHDQVGGVEALV